MFPSKKKEPKFKFRRTPPPNYQQRSTKLRVFAAVAAIILIMAVVERSRHPESWNWFLKTPQQEPTVDTRLMPKPSRTEFDPPGTIVQTGQATETGEEKPEPTEPTPAELAWRQGWKEIYPLLDSTERTLLFEILAQGRGKHQLGPAALEQAGKLVLKLNENWNAYSEAAFQSLAELREDEQASWQTILRTANERWSKDTRPALEAAAQGVAVEGEQLAGLNRFQQSLDQLLLNLVKDDTPLRPDENQLWFRLLNEAHETPPAELNRRVVKGVTYLQMFEQSHHYRGDVLRFRGAVRWAWRNPAVDNPWGLKEYYVLWIHPHGGPNRPIMVHARTLPAGFPEIGERKTDGSFTKLNEDVHITGFFLKRQVYLASDGTHKAPLLLVDSFEWNRAASSLQSGSQFEMTWPIFLSMIAGTLAASLAAAGFIYWRIREQTGGRVHDEAIAQADISALQNVQLTPSTEEGLKQLERDLGRRES